MSREHLDQTISSLHLDLEANKIEKLAKFRDLILTASRDFNLTSLRDARSIDQRHIVESIAFTVVMEEQGLLPDGAKVLDLGTGAGLPGVPMKVLRPDIELALLDSNGKKCDFLRQTIAALDLTNTSVAEGRAETLGRDPAHRARYDLVIARAVAPLPILLEYALPFLRIGGHLAGTKGSGFESELAASALALRELGSEVVARLPFQAPFGMQQSILIVRKLAETPARYPRRPGIPTKRPLT